MAGPNPRDRALEHCVFNGQDRRGGLFLFNGSRAAVCSNCLALVAQLFWEDPPESRARGDPPATGPRSGLHPAVPRSTTTFPDRLRLRRPSGLRAPGGPHRGP